MPVAHVTCVTRVTFRVSAHVTSALYDRAHCLPAITMFPSDARKFRLESECSVKWTATQERSISRDYPLHSTSPETADDYVLRTYLQFLWLPEVSTLLLRVPSYMCSGNMDYK